MLPGSAGIAAGCCSLPATTEQRFSPSLSFLAALGFDYGSGSGASPELIHQMENPFADLEQLLPRFLNHCLRQKLPGRDRLQSGLRLVQMIQGPLQVCDSESGVGKPLPTSNAVQGPP